MSATEDSFGYYARQAHWRMDAALAAITTDTRRYYARIAMVAAQSARHRATSLHERAESASLIREAEALLP